MTPLAWYIGMVTISFFLVLDVLVLIPMSIVNFERTYLFWIALGGIFVLISLLAFWSNLMPII